MSVGLVGRSTGERRPSSRHAEARMHRHFDEELKLLKERLLTMGSFAERALHRAVEALVKHDQSTLPEVFAIEKQVNALEVEIEQDVLSLIARRQPVAADLRFLVMAIKIAGE